MKLYQHSAHCSKALQHFLDYNFHYWCFVPMKRPELIMHNASRQHLPATHRTSDTSWTRTDEEVRSLVENVPKPPTGFEFSMYQRQQQASFFKSMKDQSLPRYNVDLYNADIVAICK